VIGKVCRRGADTRRLLFYPFTEGQAGQRGLSIAHTDAHVIARLRRSQAASPCPWRRWPAVGVPAGGAAGRTCPGRRDRGGQQAHLSPGAQRGKEGPAPDRRRVGRCRRGVRRPNRLGRPGRSRWGAVGGGPARPRPRPRGRDLGASGRPAGVPAQRLLNPLFPEPRRRRVAARQARQQQPRPAHGRTQLPTPQATRPRVTRSQGGQH